MFNLALLVLNIEKLCNKKKIKVSQMLTECNLHKDTIGNMKRNRVPGIDKISNIADYFGVSLDYLVKEQGIQSVNANSAQKESLLQLTEDEQEIIDIYGTLTKPQKAIIKGEMYKMQMQIQREIQKNKTDIEFAHAKRISDLSELDAEQIKLINSSQNLSPTK